MSRRLQRVGLILGGLRPTLLIVGLMALVLGGPVGLSKARGSGNGQLDFPSDVATDAAGNVYVVDSGRIQKFTSNGTFIARWGIRGSGKGLLDSPDDIATDTSGNVYVTVHTFRDLKFSADEFDHSSIQKFSADGAFITEWGGFGTGNGQFDELSGVATDAVGNVYVADNGGTNTENNRVQKFTSNGAFVTKWGEDSRSGPSGQFDSFSGVATDPAGNVYVTDQGIGNRSLQKFTSDGVFITKWGSKGSGNGRFDFPSDVATDLAGNVYVADTGINRVQKFTADGAFVTKWGSHGSGKGQFDFPYGIATDAAGNVYVADSGNNRIQKFTSDGAFITEWGHGPRSRSGHKRKPLTIPTTRRRVTFRAACRLSNRCRAMVTVKAGSKTLARGRYSIPAHSTRQVSIGLTRAGRESLARQPRVRAKLKIVDTRTHKRETLPVVLQR